MSRRAAVLGSPVAHSLSPALHRAAYAALGLDWTYEAVECRENDLPAVLARPWAGLSLTMPLKRAVLPLLDEVSALARAVGGANTVVFEGRPTIKAGEASRRARGVEGVALRGAGEEGSPTVKIGEASPTIKVGFNTDVYGIVTALREAGIEAPGSAVVLGGGATACSALAALRELRLPKADLVVRDTRRAAAAVAAAERLRVAASVRTLAEPLPHADLIICTLPAGAADPYADAIARAANAVFDVVYHPWPTPVAEAVRARGGVIVDGFAMLLHQAVRQVTLMTGREDVPVERMCAAGRAELARR